MIICHAVKELIELKDCVSECSIVSPEIIFVLLGEICRELFDYISTDRLIIYFIMFICIDS